MHFDTGTALIVTALVAAIVLITERGDRLFPGLAVLAAGVEALIAFDIMKLSVSSFRIDLILAGLLTVAGAVCWGRTAAKPQVTAATLVTAVGVLQLLASLNVLN